MTSLRIAFVLFIAVMPAVAQISTGPGVCFSFNMNPSSVSYVPLVAGGELFLGFTAPVTALVERIDIYASFVAGSNVVSVQVFQSTGTALGPFVGSGASIPPSDFLIPLILSPPLPVTTGSSYAMRLTISAGFLLITGDSSQPTPIPYLLNCGVSPPLLSPSCASYPVTGAHGAMLSFRSNSCGQTPYAVATQVGTGCGGLPPGLGTNTPPVLGTQFTFSVNGFFQTGSCQIFWAAGPATAGLNLGLGGGCSSYLDPVSLQGLAAAGLEPLVSFPIMGVFNGTTVSIPLNPALAGTTVTAQALLYLNTPTGIPTPFGNLALSNALELTLGY
jgi:hypothetical protein